MNFSPEEFNQILSIFQDESTEIIGRFNSNLMNLEKTPDHPQVISSLFQDAHSIKGAARMVGFYNIQNIAHKIEDILTLLKEGKIAISQNIITVLCKASDLLLYLVENSTKYRNDFFCDSIITTSNELEDIISSTNNVVLEKIKKHDIEEIKSKQSVIKDILSSQTSNIAALVLESIYITEKYNQDEKETYFSVLLDNFVNLNKIFEMTDYKEAKEKIIDFTNILKKTSQNIGLLNQGTINSYKEYLNEIKTSVNFVFEDLSLPPITTRSEDKEKQKNSESKSTEECKIADEAEDNLKIKEKLDYLAGNLSQIKHDPSYIENSQKYLLSLMNIDIKEDVIKIYQKMYAILNLVKKLNIKPDNDVISILTQSINITKKILLDNDASETEDLSLLLQRLSIVEQMIDITITQDTSIVEPSPMKKNLQPEFQKIQDFFKMFEIGTIKTLRVDTQKLDTLISQTGELIINGIKTQKHLSELDKFNSKLTEWNSFLKKTFNYIKYFDKKNINKIDSTEALSNFNKQLLNIFQANIDSVNGLVHDINELYKQINEDDVKLNHIIIEIESIVKSIRVLPLATVFHMFPRMVRDIAENSNKKVELLISGGDTSVDKKIIEEIKIPLIHILRNSIDHGIESPEDRVKNNKSPIGQIHLSASYSENRIIIEIQDDGTGINLKKIKEKAVQKGILTSEEMNSMTDEQIMNLIFWPGFSTGEQVTEISGRGIGLDIVQSKIAQLNGKIKIHSVINQGAKVVIELPISMSTVKSFVVTVADQKFAIPMNVVKSVQWINKDKIFLQDGHYVILSENQTIPVFDLGQIMELKSQEDKSINKFTVIIIEYENAKIAYVVDKLLGDQEILQKKLSPPIFKLKNISGITTLASGDLCLIFNVPELIKNTLNNIDTIESNMIKLISAKKENTLSAENYKILLVDDSKTTLALVERILLSEGYKVTACNNPSSAILKMKHEQFDLIISDIKMPELTGKELISFIKNDENLSGMPVIIISTLSTIKMKEMFKDFEVEHYIHKLKFNKDVFLEKVQSIFKQKERL